MRTFLKLGILAAALLLVGCGDGSTENPVIKHIGEFKGCDVSYVDRGQLYKSFYIATCDGSVVTTGQTGGKNSTPIVNIQNIPGLSKEEKDMIVKNRDAARQSALSKLTDEEKTVLGVK